jgi:hypothetical protein
MQDAQLSISHLHTRALYQSSVRQAEVTTQLRYCHVHAGFYRLSAIVATKWTLAPAASHHPINKANDCYSCRHHTHKPACCRMMVPMLLRR